MKEILWFCFILVYICIIILFICHIRVNDYSIRRVSLIYLFVYLCPQIFAGCYLICVFYVVYFRVNEYNICRVLFIYLFMSTNICRVLFYIFILFEI